MVTCAQSSVFKLRYPFVGLCELATSQFLSCVVEPQNLQDVLTLPHWLQVMKVKYEALTKNRTWLLVPYRGQKLVNCKWVFKTKLKADGSLLKHKARLVAKGFQQSAGLDYGETFSPVVKPTTICLILTLAATYKWPIRHVNNAFLNGYLKEEVFMK
ncbi:hypothetical protein QN277_000765 [Acacia crassicarpa]|uniref:Reverse transcriptase Ty1/copia-type domain-containing protein n=1 Tax=Acacia crassicarpa TaxID=499986 RepID=A0AAE1N8C1_9FABA|nr:hypothetical protein QN277_000765 [Acacia crassicarpa]